jgi:hypothetical protein
MSVDIHPRIIHQLELSNKRPIVYQRVSFNFNEILLVGLKCFFLPFLKSSSYPISFELPEKEQATE